MSLHIAYERYTLANGLQVILHRDTRVPIVSVNLWYHVGSRNERPGKTGFAHLFEHMMFQGSEHIPAEMHFQYIQSIGGTLNGSTFYDRTNYYETVPSHYLETALWLESDRMGFFLPALTQQKLDTQLDVVKNERRQNYDNQPYGLWLERLMELSFESDFPYHWPVIGYMDDLNTATMQDVQEFFTSWYQPSNASLVVAGDFETDETKTLIETYFAGIPSTPKPSLNVRPYSDFNAGEKRERMTDKVQLPRIYMGYHLPPVGHPHTYAADLLSDALSVGKSGRLYRNLVYSQQIAQEAQAFLLPMELGSMFIFVATPKPGGSIDELETALQREIDVLQTELVSSADRQRIQNQLEARKLRELQSVSSRADYLNMFNIYFDNPDLINTELDVYRQITKEQLRNAAQTYLKPENRTVLTFLPETEELS